MYAVTGFAATILATIVLDASRATLRIPFTYGHGDELTAAMSAKWLTQEPWIFSNSRLGMPGHLDMSGWPQPDLFLLAIIKLIGFTTDQFGLIINLFYLATFPAIALVALYVFRQFHIGFPTSIFASLVYTSLPYHFYRGVTHLFLSAYQMVPLLILIAFRVASSHPPFVCAAHSSHRAVRFHRNGLIFALVVCTIAGGAGIYYAFFACCLILIAGSTASLSRRDIAPIASAVIAVSLISASGVASVLPYLRHSERRMAERSPAEAETYGLKITQLILPVSGHRIASWARLKARYRNSAPLVNENDSATLGLIGTAGFLFLLGFAANKLTARSLGSAFPADDAVLATAAVLTLAATLIGTVAGFGSLISYLIFPQIRSYNRISIYIAFLALLAIALLVDRGLAARLRSGRGKLLYCAGLTVSLFLAVMDQTTREFVPRYKEISASFYSDECFIHDMEKRLPPNAMIFQLPYLVFPYASRYDHAVGFLHSTKLRWSYGALQGSEVDLWQRVQSNLPAREMVDALRTAGFVAIYIDRNLYADRGAEIEQGLSATLGAAPLTSPNARLSFFPITPTGR